LGILAVHAQDDADLFILNTCHIREKAAEKVYSELGLVRQLKNAKARRGDHMIVAVGGCVAQAEGAEVLRRAPFVDLVFGPQSYHLLPELIGRACVELVAVSLPLTFRSSPNLTTCLNCRCNRE